MPVVVQAEDDQVVLLDEVFLRLIDRVGGEDSGGTAATPARGRRSGWRRWSILAPVKRGFVGDDEIEVGLRGLFEHRKSGHGGGGDASDRSGWVACLYSVETCGWPFASKLFLELRDEVGGAEASRRKEGHMRGSYGA